MRSSLYRRDGIYYAYYYDAAGNRVRRSTKCTDRRAAEAALRRFEREGQGAPRRAQDAAAHSLHQALEDFCELGTLGKAEGTREMYAQKAGHITRLLGDRDVNGLTLDDGLRYVATREEEGASPGSIVKELVTLRQTLKFAHRRRLMVMDPRAPIPDYKARSQPKTRFLTLPEFRALLRAFGDGYQVNRKPATHRQLWITVAVYTGGRDSEVSSLDWKDIDWGARTIRLRGTKTDGSFRVVPLHPVLSAVLAKSRQARGPVVGWWPNVRRDLAAACERAKIPKATPNDLRRTKASWLKQAGVDSMIVAQLLGHRSTRMVERVYGRLDAATLERAIQALPGGCAKGVSGSRGKRGKGGEPGIAAAERFPSEISVSEVLGAGIEPATRGFSIRATMERKSAKDKAKSAAARGR